MTLRQLAASLAPLPPAQSARIEDALAVFDDPDTFFNTSINVTAWGRRPA